MTEPTTKRTIAKRTARKPDPVKRVLDEVRAEMEFVGQGTPLWGGDKPDKSRPYYEHKAENWFHIDSGRCLRDKPGWDSRIIHYAFRAFAKADQKLVREELLTVAAAAVAAIQTIDEAAE